jgi:hypothetical protein
MVSPPGVDQRHVCSQGKFKEEDLSIDLDRALARALALLARPAAATKVATP